MKPTLKVTPIQTSIFAKGQNLAEFVIANLKNQNVEKSVIAVTSKIVSLSENRTVSKTSIDKSELIKQEADHDLGEFPYGTRLTIKHNLLIPSAGVDESNSENDDYILFPKDPFQSAKNLYQALTAHFKTKNIGVIITDSHSLPLRYGVTGISLSYWGFHGIKNLINKPDIFGRPLKFTKMDLADGLAAAAVLTMGEADDRSPIAIIENATVEFAETVDPKELLVSPQDDIYGPLYFNARPGIR